MLKLLDEIGRGKERICYLHPYDNTKIIKVIHTSKSKQMKRELIIYNQLKNRQNINYDHIPNFYGEVVTDRGTGYIFDVVINSDKTISKSLHYYLKSGFSLEEFHSQLEQLKAYLFSHKILFCNDVSYEGNILVKENIDGSLRLIIIDGLGDVILFNWINKIDYLLKQKIKRRWERCIQRLKVFDAEKNS